MSNDISIMLQGQVTMEELAQAVAGLYTDDYVFEFDAIIHDVYGSGMKARPGVETIYIRPHTIARTGGAMQEFILVSGFVEESTLPWPVGIDGQVEFIYECRRKCGFVTWYIKKPISMEDADKSGVPNCQIVAEEFPDFARFQNEAPRHPSYASQPATPVQQPTPQAPAAPIAPVPPAAPAQPIAPQQPAAAPVQQPAAQNIPATPAAPQQPVATPPASSQGFTDPAAMPTGSNSF